MDISSDAVRRGAKESQVEHDRAMGSMRSLVGRLFNGESTESPLAKADFALGGLNRRRFIQVGGITVATAAIFAACGTKKSDVTAGGGGSSTTEAAKVGAAGDIQILRTASSLEVLAVAVYDKAIASQLVTTAAIGDAAKLFRAQHDEHAKLFEGQTEKIGGKKFDQANPVVLQKLQPTIDALKDETGIVQLAYMLESVAAATYQSAVGLFQDATLNTAIMSVGGVEARHVAVLGGVLKQAQVPKAFQTTDGAVTAGTGV